MGAASPGKRGGRVGAGGASLGSVSHLGSDESMGALWVSVLQLGNLHMECANGPLPQVPRFCLCVILSSLVIPSAARDLGLACTAEFADTGTNLGPSLRSG
jgi:hypothetical protein